LLYQQLKEYAQVYIDRFANSFNRSGKRFTIEILYSKQVIGMYFKVIDESMFTDEVVFTSDNENLLPTITAFPLLLKLLAKRSIYTWAYSFNC